MNKDIKYLGVPNVCFSLTKIKNERETEFIQQRIERGFDDSETWSLDMTIANFIIPRLERYIEIVDETIVQTKEDKQELQLFLNAMKLISNNKQLENREEIQKGLNVFPKIFMGLWW